MTAGLSMNRLELSGLSIATSQIWGGVRLVPVLRRDAPGDLRLWKRSYKEDEASVDLGGRTGGPKSMYGSYVPHGLVVDWSGDGALKAAFGTRMARQDGTVLERDGHTARILHRMVKREDRHRLRILPLHVAMEGFLSLHFGGPEIAWEAYSKQVLKQGLSPRYERIAWGWELPALPEALRVFEIHDDQVGVLVFIAETLASAFIVPHPDDYRALHQTVVEDFFGPTLVHAGRYGAAIKIDIGFDEHFVKSIDDLRGALSAMQESWHAFQLDLAGGLIHQPLTGENVYRAGPFQLSRFMTGLKPTEENHIGEMIVRRDGTLEYLKTYRLSAAQTKRAFLLRQLAGHDWHIEHTAKALGQSKEQFVVRLEKAGFGYLLKDHVLRAARRKRR